MIGLAIACALAVRTVGGFHCVFADLFDVNASLWSLLLPLRTNRYSIICRDIDLDLGAAAVASPISYSKQTQSIRLLKPYQWYVGATSLVHC